MSEPQAPLLGPLHEARLRDGESLAGGTATGCTVTRLVTRSYGVSRLPSGEVVLTISEGGAVQHERLPFEAAQALHRAFGRALAEPG